MRMVRTLPEPILYVYSPEEAKDPATEAEARREVHLYEMRPHLLGRVSFSHRYRWEVGPLNLKLPSAAAAAEYLRAHGSGDAPVLPPGTYAVQGHEYKVDRGGISIQTATGEVRLQFT